MAQISSAVEPASSHHDSAVTIEYAPNAMPTSAAITTPVVARRVRRTACANARSRPSRVCAAVPGRVAALARVESLPFEAKSPREPADAKRAGFSGPIVATDAAARASDTA